MFTKKYGPCIYAAIPRDPVGGLRQVGGSHLRFKTRISFIFEK
jgi:hypothetical protein